MLHATCPCLLTYPVRYLKQVTGENLLNVLLQNSPDYKTSQISPHLLSKLAENLASLEWDKVSVFSKILLKTSHDRYKVSPVK